MAIAPHEWQRPPATLTILRHEVHLWRVPLQPAGDRLQSLAPLLSPDERERAARFRFEGDRHAFTVGRGSLRLILSRYVDCPPNAITFAYGPQGKPALGGALANHPLQFNLSHSGAWAIYAVTGDRPVGVDVEQIRAISERDRLVQILFAPQEAARFHALPPADQELAFFQYWTCKEAYIKARGVGLSLPVQQVEVALEGGTPRLVRISSNAQEAAGWAMMGFAPAPGYWAALVVAGNLGQLTHWDGGRLHSQLPINTTGLQK